ncbi:MAG: hypothetical protein M0Q24_10045, partial [Sulfurimonas sp.]|nr:hypothetical protein [Sulfurimonas sp.]
MRVFIIIFTLLFTTHIAFGACGGTNKGAWNNGTTYSSSSFTNDYYRLNITETGTLLFNLENTSSGWSNRDITFKLYANTTCNGSAKFTKILSKNSSTMENVEITTTGFYTLQITRNNSGTSKYSWSASAQSYSLTTSLRDFTIRNPIETRNIKGNIKVIGNTVLCYKNNKGVCVDTDKANNKVSLSFVDTDSVNYTYNNSSQAQIAGIPSTSKIKWAGFYTQGYLKTTQTDTINALISTPTYLTTPQGKIIALKNDAIDLNPYNKNDYTYATFTEVTALKGLSGSEVNGWYTGANIKALEGDDSGSLGYYGAWTLVLVYEDESETLKNISVYDGYKEIGSSNDSIKVSGFFTPTSGDVKSTLSVFVGEGDKTITGDDITLNNVSLSPSGTKNAFNSTVNGFNTNPDPVNYQGIDIHNYDVGKDGDSSHLQIIGNGAKSATIGLETTGDYYYPSMVAFTTELYEPRVCYKQEFFDVSGNVIEEVEVGDIITVATWISNMKKDSADTNLETADKVEITLELDS